MNKIKILTVFGTRPEVIKLAPFVKAIEVDSDCISLTCATTQHKELQNDVLNLFDIQVDHDLEIMQEGQDLFHITESVLHRIKPILSIEEPNCIVVQGDTTTAFAAALSGFYCKIPVVHIEAGLRTGNMYSPYPEEMNRCLISRIATLHMAPTQIAVNNLAEEGIIQNVFNVGNTIVDSVQWILKNFSVTPFVEDIIKTKRKIILITVHRRENFGEPLKEICTAISTLSKEYPEFLFVWPVHPNPNIRNYVYDAMANLSNVILSDPISYAELISLLNISHLTLSDSGGIQEESCILGKNIIILRKETERPEVIELGFGILVGSDQGKILSAFGKLINYSKKKHLSDVYGKPGVSELILFKIKEFCNNKHV